MLGTEVPAIFGQRLRNLILAGHNCWFLLKFTLKMAIHKGICSLHLDADKSVTILLFAANCKVFTLGCAEAIDFRPPFYLAGALTDGTGRAQCWIHPC